MAREPSRWIRLLLRLAALRASDAELGDVLEEYAGGRQGTFWVCRQIVSTQGVRPSDAVDGERRPVMLSNLWGDVRYAIRTLRRQPGFAAAAVVPIALGIGINTGIFSILNSVAFRGLPAPDAAELVSVHQQFRGVTQRRVHGARSLFSMPEYRAYRDGTQTLSGLMAYSVPQTITLGGDSPREADAVFVSCNYFDVLKLRPAIGTGFTANCESSAAAPEVILSHDLWTQTFAANRAIVGSTITVNGRAVAVAGVAPEGFDGIDLTRAALFAPVSLLGVVRPDDTYGDDPYMSWLTLVGRLTKEAGLTHVRAELAVIASQIDRQQPGRTTTVTVAPATALSLPEARRDIFSGATVVLGAFGLVLLLACANVANLLLARAAGRTKEIAVRLSVGASRGRLVQQLLTESALIALIGGVAGAVLAWWSFRGLLAVLLSSLPGTVPPLRLDATPDVTVLWFALALTAATALVFGLVPALQASKQDVQTVMKQAGANAGRRTGRWLRASLVGAQIAVSMVLLISAGLLLRALYAVNTVEPGFDYRHVAVVSFDLRGLGAEQRAAAFRQQFVERVETLPGADAVAQVGKTPLSPGRWQNMVRLPGQDPWQEIDVNTVSPGYFALIGIPIVRGRAFTAIDAVDSAAAAIVTEATARRLWPGQDPIGQRLMMSAGENQERPLDIVGVAKDAQVTGIADTERPYAYLPAGPRAQRELKVLIRSEADFAGIAASVRAVARDIDPGVAVRVNRLEENLDFWRTVSRLIAGLSGSLSLLALTLASVGVYGVVSFVVSRRRREVGIRIALGATAHDVQRLIVRQTLRPVVAGVLIGIAAAAAVSRILQSVLFGVSPFDPVAFIGAPLFLLGIALAATVVPTREALRVDPVTTLRCD